MWNRHKDYILLSAKNDTGLPRLKILLDRRTLFLLLTTVVIIASGIANIVLARIVLAPSRAAIDNYQHLNIQPLVNQEALSAYHTLANSDTHAIVTTLYSDSYATGIATLGHSLRQANTTARLVVLYIPSQVSNQALCIATSTGFVPHAVQRIPPPAGSHPYSRFIDQYTKLRLWGLDKELGLEAIVYLDGDTLVRRNFDELFSLPWNFAAVPDATTKGPFPKSINAGVLFLRPSTEVLEDMLRKIAEAKYSTVDAEQSFLNTYYAKDMVRLPYAYNVNLAIKVRDPVMWDDLMLPRTRQGGGEIEAEARIIHYTLIKPFIAERENEGKIVLPMEDIHANAVRRMDEKDGVFRPEFQEWLNMWEEVYEKYAEPLGRCQRIVG